MTIRPALVALAVVIIVLLLVLFLAGLGQSVICEAGGSSGCEASWPLQ